KCHRVRAEPPALAFVHAQQAKSAAAASLAVAAETRRDEEAPSPTQTEESEARAGRTGVEVAARRTSPWRAGEARLAPAGVSPRPRRGARAGDLRAPAPRLSRRTLCARLRIPLSAPRRDDL